MVTAITALVLFLVASASVKGFALMLLIGTAVSLVTAVGATRAMLGILSGFKWFDSPQFMGAQGQQMAKWIQIDFIGKRKYWFVLSGVVLAISIGAIAVKGLNFGIDFKGGTQVAFTSPRPVDIGEIRDITREIGQENAVIQGRGKAVGDEQYKSFTIKTESLARADQTKLETAIKNSYGDNIPFGVKNVSESFGGQLARNAILAIVVSFILICIYIWIRFDLKFAAPVIASIAHDVTIAVGIYALTGKEVTTATVAAILTVLGYSMYDTIIIFDRIRENIPLMRRSSIQTICNVSLWETIRRSLATTFITLLPISALYFFGGDTLKDFAFALLVGIGAGAYSSIFIAAPLLAMWKEREPEYARRIGQVDVDKSGAEILADAEAALTSDPPPVPGAGARCGRPAGFRGGRRRRVGQLEAPAAPTAPPSGGGRARMAGDSGLRDSVEKLGLAALGAVALTAERADALADELAARGGMRKDEARQTIEELMLRWKGEAGRVGQRSGAALDGLFQQLGVVTRGDYEELELRVAQLEHRIRLVEGSQGSP